MVFYTHLSLENASKIVILRNKHYSNYKINKITGISKGKIRQCLHLSSTQRLKERINKPWKRAKLIIKYSFKNYKIRKKCTQELRSYNYAKECEPLYMPFINFCKQLYEKRILGIMVKRSTLEYIKVFKLRNTDEAIPCKDCVYRMGHSKNYSFQIKWLPKRKFKDISNKNTI